MNQTKLNEYETEILNTETVEIDNKVYTGMQVLERIQSPMIEEGNYNYLVNCASTNAVLERMFKALGV